MSLLPKNITKSEAVLNADQRPARIIGNRIWMVADILLLMPGVLIYMAERDPATIYFTRWILLPPAPAGQLLVC